MKHFFYQKIIVAILLILVCCPTAKAQVTVGVDYQPEKAALLEIKDKKAANPGEETSTSGGILFPRVNLVKKNQLLPFFDVSSVGSTSYENVEKPAHKGLFVYNLTDDSSDPDGEGFEPAPYYWDGEKWLRVEKGKEPAIFTIDNCTDDIKVYGEYGNGVALTTSNFITVKVNVKKAGAYSINITTTDSNNDNGYFFLTSGEFLSTGVYSIVVPGMGTPINHQTDEFTVALNGVRQNGSNPACTVSIEVKDTSIRPKYKMDCSKTQVYGQYYEEQPLDATHYIEITLEVETSSFSSSYEIETNEVDGIKFKGSGILTSSPQIVRLYGEGVPFDNRDKKMYIKTNSESSTATCVATVFIIIPQKRMMTIGTDALFGYNLGRVGSQSNQLVTDLLNFGPNANSIVRYSGFKNAGTAYNSNEMTASGANSTDDGRDIIMLTSGTATSMSITKWRELLFGTGSYPKIDIITIGYDWGGMSTDQADAIVEWMQGGGILLMFCENGTQNQMFLRKVFGKDDITVAAGGPPGSIYRYASIDDPILNGPFGNITGLTWGEDASTSYYATNLPLEDVVLYTSNQNISGSSGSSTLVENSATSFRHRTLPFVWVGDGGFNSSNTSTVADQICPFKIGSKKIGTTTYPNYPTYRANFGPAGYRTWNVYNALFTANAISWCIKTAEELKRKQKE